MGVNTPSDSPAPIHTTHTRTNTTHTTHTTHNTQHTQHAHTDIARSAAGTFSGWVRSRATLSREGEREREREREEGDVGRGQDRSQELLEGQRTIETEKSLRVP